MNEERNKKVEEMLKVADSLGLGSQVDAQISKANVLASLDIAESLQSLRLQIAQSSASNESTLRETTDKTIESNRLLSKSNDRHAGAMEWLTGALIFVGFVQVIIQLLPYFLHK